MTREELKQYIAENQVAVSDKFIRELIDYDMNEYNEVLSYEDAERSAHKLHSEGCLCQTAICWDCKAYHDGCCPKYFNLQKY